MIDDVVQYPNRYQLVPVAGTTDQFDLVRMPGAVTAVGTPINKATLLKDSTAAKYGLGASAVPDEVFAKIKTLLDGKAKATVTGSYVGTGTFGSSNRNTLTFEAPPVFLFIVGPTHFQIYFKNLTTAVRTSSTSSQTLTTDNSNTVVTWLENGVSWNSTSAALQQNESGKTYTYVAMF